MIMKKIIITGTFVALLSLGALAQTKNVVLIEEFTETGCGACSQYDSSFQAMTNANADKVAVINYHCFYTEDPFFKYNKTGDQRYAFYGIKDGFPSVMMNGKKPGVTTAHMHYATEAVINKMAAQPAQFKFEIISKSTGKGTIHSANVQVKATALKNIPSKDLRLFVVATENNINYKERYHSTAVNGINNFNHIIRAMLPDTKGISMGSQIAGDEFKAKVSYINDDKEINFKEVQFVVFIQDVVTKEVLGAAVLNENPFK